MIWTWLLAAMAGLAIASVASRLVVDNFGKLAFDLGVPPFLFGLTVMAIGTDLPEIANSIIASVTQHGDMNIGDSVGSTVTQVTLVLGLLPLLSGAFGVGRRQVVLAGAFTCAALILGVILLRDGFFSRLDGGILVTSWLVGSVGIWYYSPPASQSLPVQATGNWVRHAAAAFAGLAVVVGGAYLAISSFIELANYFGFPEYLITFFAGAIGTSLPELFVDVQAIRRGAHDLAVGDIFGSSFVDATLSIGIGPIIAATPITAQLAVRGGLTSAIILLLVTLLFSRIRKHDWRSGTLLLILYFALYPLLLQ